MVFKEGSTLAEESPCGILTVEHYQYSIHWYPTDGREKPVREIKFVVLAERIEENSPASQPDHMSKEETSRLRSGVDTNRGDGTFYQGDGDTGSTHNLLAQVPSFR